MADDGPPLLRPIPRRPFALALKTPTPPQDNEDEDETRRRRRQEYHHDDDNDDEDDYKNLLLAHLRHEFSASGLLGPQHYSPPASTDSPSSISRPASYMNLTSSTLAGIYEPTAAGQDRAYFNDTDRDDELHTPWGTGAETPVKKRPSIDEATYELMCDRSQPPRRRRSSYNTAETAPMKYPSSTVGTALSLVSRAALLFLLGVGYGVVVTRFHSSSSSSSSSEQTLGVQGPGGKHLIAFWGVSAVVLGALQPWFDKVWEDAFGLASGEVEGSDSGNGNAGPLATKDPGPGTDWALVMRAIGAFVGIVFAIRKLAWTSTLQLSATLALVNPLLWWLIDRSMPGFVLSAGVGLTGSMLLLGVNPEMMPAPSGPITRSNSSAESSAADFLPLTLGGLASPETVEAGVWMLSVLFCSCLCFGNIGRRLAWSKSAVGRGRWGGLP